MDGECGHSRTINLCAKPRTKKPTNSRVQGALSSAMGQSRGRGLETSSALGGQTPSPVAPAPLLWSHSGCLCLRHGLPLGTPSAPMWTRSQAPCEGIRQGLWGLQPLSYLINEKNESKIRVSSQQTSSCVIAAPVCYVHPFRTISAPVNVVKALPS